MTSPVRIIHAAQCRLDVPARGFKDVSALSGPARVALEDASLDAFDRLIERTRELDADALLLVGNTLRAADKSLRARRRLEQGLERLADADIAAVVVPGPMDPAGTYASLHLPDSAVVLSSRRPSTTIKAGRREAEITLDEDARSDADFTVVAVPPGEESVRPGKPRKFDPARGSGVVYWAMGDGVTTSADMSGGVAHDPGPLSPTGVRTTGVCGAALVEIETDGDVRTRPVPCSPLVCETVEVSVVGVRSLESLAERMADRLPDFRREAELTVVNWDLTGSGPVLTELSPSRWADLIELVDEEAGRERVHVYDVVADEGEADEIAAMLIDEYTDRISAGDLDPRDEYEDVDSPALEKVLASAAASPRMAERTRRLGAAVFAESCGTLWDAA